MNLVPMPETVRSSPWNCMVVRSCGRQPARRHAPPCPSPSCTIETATACVTTATAITVSQSVGGVIAFVLTAEPPFTGGTPRNSNCSDRSPSLDDEVGTDAPRRIVSSEHLINFDARPHPLSVLCEEYPSALGAVLALT